jgi:hypothetical protein
MRVQDVYLVVASELSYRPRPRSIVAAAGSYSNWHIAREGFRTLT